MEFRTLVGMLEPTVTKLNYTVYIEFRTLVGMLERHADRALQRGLSRFRTLVGMLELSGLFLSYIYNTSFEPL